MNEYPLDRRFAAFTRPGTYFASPHSSGLGFGLGAALGVKLGRPEATVIATVATAHTSSASRSRACSSSARTICPCSR